MLFLRFVVRCLCIFVARQDIDEAVGQFPALSISSLLAYTGILVLMLIEKLGADNVAKRICFFTNILKINLYFLFFSRYGR
jgi:hypothetical protein